MKNKTEIETLKEQNAALVEALAETTEALKEARRYLSLGDRDAMRAYTETGEVQTKARAAIAKAEGRE